jgi:hypothetical protein
MAARALGSQASSTPAPIENRRPRRVAAAFLLGAAISAAGLAALAANRAGAHGPFTAANPTSFALGQPAYAAARPSYGLSRFEAEAVTADAPRRRRLRGRVIAAAGGAHLSRVGHSPVCVRLCDGAFFPLAAAADAGSQTAACGSLCPDAPTEVFYRNGSDRIEDAVSATGRPYSALPVALRYSRTSDSTCACHRDVVAYAPLRDATLQRGDAIMTPAGFVVFNGAAGGAHAARDFTALSRARVPSAQRGALQAMERISVADNHPTLKDWLALQAAPALAHRRDQRFPARIAKNDDRIRLLVWRGGAED